MSFVHPAFLWALSALAIPVLIHLFQLRRFKRIDFPNVRHLAEVSQQTRARRKVQHWLVLLARMLALTFLVLAFAQPFIPASTGAAKAGQRAVSLFIDDSFSMDGQNTEGRLLDQARRDAQETIMAHSATDRFQVLGGGFQGRQQLLLGRDEALDAAAGMEVGPYSRPISQVLDRQRAALLAHEAPVKRVFLFTDLQRTVTDVQNWTNDTLVPTVIVPLVPSTPDNLSIDSVWFEGPVRRAGQPEALHVRIRNHGGQDLVNIPLRLSVNGRPRALATFGVGAGDVVDTTLRFTSGAAGLYQGEVSITDQPVSFDDRMHLAYRVTDRLRVLLVSGEDPPGDRAVAAVFEGDSLHRFEVRSHRNLDLASIAGQDLMVLNAVPDVPSGLAQALADIVDGGASLAVFPPAGGDPAGYNALLQLFNMPPASRMDTALARVERIDLEQPFYKAVFQTMPRNVDLPVARERWHIRPPAGSEVLLRMQDGSPYLARIPMGRGALYLCSTPLDERSGNLVRHALFATSLLRMAESARPMGALYHTLGTEALIPLEGIELNGEQPPRLLGPEGIDIVPEVRNLPAGTELVLHDLDLPPGAYRMVVGKDTAAMVALNLSRLESDLSTLSPDELKASIMARGLTSFTVLEGSGDDLSLRLTELDQGRKLWKWAVLLALLFLATEVFLIRRAR